MTLYAAWGFILTAMGLAAMWLVPKKPKLGWSIGLASEAVWLAFAVATNQPGFVIGAILYGIVYGRNLWRCCVKTKADPYAEVKVPLRYNYAKADIALTSRMFSALRYGRKGQGKTTGRLSVRDPREQCMPKSGLTMSAVDAVLKQEYQGVMRDILADTNRVLWGSETPDLSKAEIRNVRRLLAVQAENDAARRLAEELVRKAERKAKKLKKAKKLVAKAEAEAYHSPKTKKESKSNG